MEISLTTAAVAALAGMIGSLIGGMETFILYGGALLVQAVMMACGADVTDYTAWITNLFLLPACIFNGSVAATGYAAKKHEIQAWEIEKSLAFTHDPKVMLVGGGAAAFGYVLCALISNSGFGIDAGSASVVTVGVICRLLFPRPQIWNPDAPRALNDRDRWIFDLMVAGCAAAAGALLVKMTGFVSIGFGFSAFLLLFQLFDKAFPTTHHVTMTAGYAVMASGSLVIAVLFGLLAHAVFMVFAAFFNMGCGSHIDPPAVAIGICSLLIFAIF